jgi:hypothetical protein
MLEGMKYGSVKDGRFVPGEAGDSFVVAYQPKRIGRGIQIHWDNNDIRYTCLVLNLPAPDEELDDFFQMAARLARQDLSEVELNGKPFGPKQFHEVKRSFHVYNLKLLHEMMGNVLNKEPERLSIGCVFHRLAAGMKEAETMWAGINTDQFRDWLHASQSFDAFYSEANVRKYGSESSYQAVFTMPADHTVILPDHEELPIRFYDLSTGRPRFEISDWIVELVDQSRRRVLGSIPLKQFRTLLPKEKVSYFDAADSLLEPFTEEELQFLLQQAEQENG